MGCQEDGANSLLPLEKSRKREGTTALPTGQFDAPCKVADARTRLAAEMDMDRLLVATDFSPRSDRALRRASLLARKLGSALTLVHVVDAEQPERLVAADRTAASELLDEMTATLRDGDGIDAGWILTEDDVVSGILRAAGDISAELVVIGPNRKRLRDIFTGTTAERVVQQSGYPILVAVDTPSGDYRKTLLALDFDEASKAAGRAALAMGVFDQTEVVVMHAFDAPAQGLMRRAMMDAQDIDDYVDTEESAAAAKLRELRNELRLPRTEHSVVAMTGGPARTILESAQTGACDLIVIGATQRRGLERVLVGSVTADVIRDAHRDILIIPAGEQA
jgi:nucleotide-binding universal stress UspA family protein